MHWLVRSSSFSKAQGLHETGSREEIDMEVARLQISTLVCYATRIVFIHNNVFVFIVCQHAAQIACISCVVSERL